MPRAARERNVVEFSFFSDTAQKQTASAHIATPCKFGRESQPVTENGSQRVEILACCNAAEQNHFTVLTKLTRQMLSALNKRFLKAFLCQANLHL